jgi:hypothetical protein
MSYDLMPGYSMHYIGVFHSDGEGAPLSLSHTEEGAKRGLIEGGWTPKQVREGFASGDLFFARVAVKTVFNNSDDPIEEKPERWWLTFDEEI